MMRSITPRGFVFDATPAPRVGDSVEVDLGSAGRLIATVVGNDDGAIRCAFVSPLAPDELAAARNEGRVVLTEEYSSSAEPGRWPRPVRAAVAVGGALALWGLVALALG